MGTFKFRFMDDTLNRTTSDGEKLWGVNYTTKSGPKRRRYKLF